MTRDDDLELSVSSSSTQRPFDENLRTPVIEDSHHPFNVWRSENRHDRTADDRDTGIRGHLDQQYSRQAEKKSRQNADTESQRPMPDEHGHLPFRERVKHTTWAYFTMTMATGGIANVIHTIPFQSDWLHIVGLIFFFLNIALYITIWAMILTRFISYPSTFRESIIHPTESLFVPAFAVSLGTVCITIVEYGANNAGHWLTDAVWGIFWFNVGLAFILSITIYMILWTSLTFTIAQMTPIWIFPAYPLLIIGPHASNLAAKLDSPTRALQVIVGGFTVQGIGFLVSLTIYSSFIYRLMSQKLPADPSRPGMFVSVGPAAFTCSGTIGMASNLQRAIVGSRAPGEDFMGVDPVLAAQVLRLVGNWMCLWLWGLALWFFFVSVISNVAPLFTHKDVSRGDKKWRRNSHAIPFAMTWYSYVFPQTALTTATLRVADAFEIHALKIVGCVMTGLLIAMWLFVVSMMIRAVILKQILWPETGEDREEGGFKNKQKQRQQ